MLTGVNQTGAKLQVARADDGSGVLRDHGADGARPSHAEGSGRRTQFHRGGAVDFMGKRYPDFEARRCGTGAGLCGWNCRHTFFAIFPELGAPPAWTAGEFETLNARDIKYNGDEIHPYEISQMQRAGTHRAQVQRRYLAEDAAGATSTAGAVKLRAGPSGSG